VISVRWRFVLGLAISAACLVWVFHDVSIRSLRQEIHIESWSWVGVAVCAQSASYVFQGFRWQRLLRPLGELSVVRATEAIYAGLFVNELMPAKPGELLRAYLVGQWLQIRMPIALGSIVTERIFDGIWLSIALTFVAAVVPLPKQLAHAGVIFILLLATVAVVVSVLATSRVQVPLLSTWRHALSSRNGVIAFANSGLLILSQMLAFWCALRGFGLPLSPTVAIATIVVIQLGTAVPNAPGNVGTYQLACVAGLTHFGVDKTTATAFSVIVFVLLTLPVWCFGVIALAHVSVGRTIPQEAEWGNSSWLTTFRLSRWSDLSGPHRESPHRPH
jgi:glycosyltransferase 2 family protein